MTATGFDAVANEVTIVLPAQLPSITTARRLVRDVVREWGLDDLDDDIQLGTSELVTNAVRHAQTEFVLTIRLDDSVTISVTDGDPDLHLQPHTDDVRDVHGRGLRIVAAISSDWGVRTAGAGKTVWFSMALPAPDPAPIADVLPLARMAD